MTQQRGFDLIVAIDFGTTFSGVTFQVRRHGQRVGPSLQVRGWPSEGRGEDEAKVPTKLRYCKNGDGDYVVAAWGYQVVGDDDLTFEWFKLLLLAHNQLPDYLKTDTYLLNMKQRLQSVNKTAVDVIADYLTALWEHAVKPDEDDLGVIRQMVVEDIDKMPIHVVFTIPAIWDDLTKEGMKNAANKSIITGNASSPAGPITYEFLSEPEAAAHAYADDITRSLDVGDAVLIFDLGGGTGDCVSYQLTDRDEFNMEEIVSSTGDLCGGSILDQAFMKLCKETLHSARQPTTETGWQALMSDGWEAKIKRSFKYSDGKKRTWPLPLSAQNNNVVYFNEDQLRDVFQSSVMPTIIRLVQDQVSKIEAKIGKPPKMILLVGGFGRCPYIREALQHVFGSGNKKRKSSFSPIKIITDQGDMPWSAISRGAIEHVLKPRIESRIAQRSIGFMQNLRATAAQGGVYDELWGGLSVPDGMTWVIKKGDVIKSSSKIIEEQVRYTVAYAKEHSNDQPEDDDEDFYTHDSENPPARYGTGEGFQKWGVITLKFPLKIRHMPTIKTGQRNKYFPYCLRITTSGASTEIKAVTDKQLVSKGINVGTVVGLVTLSLSAVRLGEADQSQARPSTSEDKKKNKKPRTLSSIQMI